MDVCPRFTIRSLWLCRAQLSPAGGPARADNSLLARDAAGGCRGVRARWRSSPPRDACLGPVASATFAATRLGAGRERALRCRELVLAGPQVTRIRDQLHATLVIRDGGKDVDTHVDATSPTRWRQWGNLDVAP